MLLSGYWQAWDPRRADDQFESKGRKRLKSVRQLDFPLLQPFCFIQVSNWSIRPIHVSMVGRAICFSHFTDSNVQFIHNILTDTPKLFDQMTEHPVALDKLTHYLNHHKPLTIYYVLPIFPSCPLFATLFSFIIQKIYLCTLTSLYMYRNMIWWHLNVFFSKCSIIRL